MRDETIERVFAAVEHARVLMFRAEPDEQIDHDLERLGRIHEVVGPLKEDYAVAIEILATVPPDTLNHFVNEYLAARAS